ncbi:BolA family transcriptional regulator [Paracoccus sp. SCSIO 75233]|uniref:BolA family protein n=1 Tax=Paracoccus sp. SCSIO 75233 TaxID=3017782 RepID=UPI0022F0C725|nr:BolA family protein [Paracoccus sp. SCSIO 75233]WBU54496.1 BolA family transcriptional regulator [Paracoccus sp. SCSIO 75233]
MIADEMRDALKKLNPTLLEVIDESEQHRGHAGWRDGGETHFRVRIASPEFSGLNRVARHRLIHSTLGDIVGRIHALAIEVQD